VQGPTRPERRTKQVGDEHTAVDDESDQHAHGYASYFFTGRTLKLLEG